MALLFERLASVFTLLLIVQQKTAAQDHGTSYYGYPMIFPYGNCDSMPDLQTLSLHVTTMLSYRSTFRGFQIGGYSGAINSINSAPVDDPLTVELMELNTGAGSYFTCQTYYCFEKPSNEIIKQSNGTCNETEMITGFLGYTKNDPTAMLIVNQKKGESLINIHAALPWIMQTDPAESYVYYTVHGSRSRVHHINGVAIMALNESCTTVTIEPTVDIYVYTERARQVTIDIVISGTISREYCLEQLEVMWIEEIVDECDGAYQHQGLRGTKITSSSELFVYSSEAECNETEAWINRVKSFSYVADTVDQIPSTKKWGKVFVADLLHLNTLSIPALASLYILASNNDTIVTVTAYKQEESDYQTVKLLQMGQSFEVVLSDTNMTSAIIQASQPLLVLYEAYTPNDNHVLFSTLVQPVEWYTAKQSVLLSRPISQQFEYYYHIALVIPSKYYNNNVILVKDIDSGLSGTVPLEKYERFEKCINYTIQEYTILQCFFNSSTAGDHTDKVIEFMYDSTQPCGKLGATVYAYNQNGSGYAYSNGYILDDSPLTETVGLACSATLLRDDNYTHPLITGVVAACVLLILIMTTCFCIGLRFHCMPGRGLAEPPAKGFEFDVFLSFADKDKDFVSEILYTPLKEKGYLVNWHHKDFIAGLTIEENILRAIRISRWIVFVCSEHFHQSEFCQKELKYGLDSHYNHHKGKYRRVVPVVIQDGECPEELQQLRPIEVDKLDSSDKKSIQELMDTLKLGKPIEHGKSQKRVWWRKEKKKRKNKKADEEEESIMLDTISPELV